MADLSRWLRHLFARPAASLFPEATLQRVTQAIGDGEAMHTAEICFAVEPALPARRAWQGVDARERALEVFAQLRVWDTAANNGVLAYLLLADHRIEIVADRGLDGLVGTAQWREVCAAMEGRLRDGDGEGAAIEGVAAISRLLARHFPRSASAVDANELPDRPHLL